MPGLELLGLAYSYYNVIVVLYCLNVLFYSAGKYKEKHGIDLYNHV